MKQKKAKARVARARAKMGVGAEQPSIMESIQAKSSRAKPASGRGESVNTLKADAKPDVITIMPDDASQPVTPGASTGYPEDS